MISLVRRAGFVLGHSLVHLLLYILPESLYNVFFRWPICFLEWLIGEEKLTLAPRKERYILTVCSRASRDVYDLFGLREDMYYEGPMYSGHVHTILAAFRLYSDVAYRREVVVSEDGNPLCIDCLPPAPSNGKEGAKALVLILPGLSSCSQAVYIRRMATLLSREGYYVSVLNARGVGDTPLEKPFLFSAVQTSDLRYVLKSVFDRKMVKQRLKTSDVKPLIAIGFSIGGIVLSKYFGEQGARKEMSHVDAGFAVTSPFDMNSARTCIEGSLYDWPLLSDLCKYAERHKQLMERLPGVDGASLFNPPHRRVQKMRSITDFDRYITAPHFGFRSPEDYYHAADCFISLRTTTTPFMCIAARDDPICGAPSHTRRWEKLTDINSNVTYVEFPSGGHVGFLGNPITELMRKPSALECFVLQSIRNVCINAKGRFCGDSAHDPG